MDIPRWVKAPPSYSYKLVKKTRRYHIIPLYKFHIVVIVRCKLVFFVTSCYIYINHHHKHSCLYSLVHFHFSTSLVRQISPSSHLVPRFAPGWVETNGWRWRERWRTTTPPGESSSNLRNTNKGPRSFEKLIDYIILYIYMYMYILTCKWC